jgi:hypothetical protein
VVLALDGDAVHREKLVAALQAAVTVGNATCGFEKTVSEEIDKKLRGRLGTEVAPGMILEM